jgi:DNA-binding transcriptional LysR family regulator
LRLLPRTTRSISVTDAGERLLESSVRALPRLKQNWSRSASSLSSSRGTVRSTSADYTVDTVICPRLAKVPPKYPDLNVEITIAMD